MNTGDVATKNALIIARDLNPRRKGELEKLLEEMEQTSSMSGEVLNHIWKIYQENEPKRVYFYIINALKIASKRARPVQEYSEMPLEQSVNYSVLKEDQESEPQRNYPEMNIALSLGNPINDKSSMNALLRDAQEHSHGLLDNAITYVAGLLIKMAYVLFH